MNRRDFIISKLNNLISWIEKDKIVSKDNPLLVELKSRSTNFDNVLQFISYISKFADKEGNIADNKIEELLSKFKMSIKDFKEDHIDKLKKYLKCFIKVVNY